MRCCLINFKFSLLLPAGKNYITIAPVVVTLQADMKSYLDEEDGGSGGSNHIVRDPESTSEAVAKAPQGTITYCSICLISMTYCSICLISMTYCSI